MMALAASRPRPATPAAAPHRRRSRRTRSARRRWWWATRRARGAVPRQHAACAERAAAGCGPEPPGPAHAAPHRAPHRRRRRSAPALQPDAHGGRGRRSRTTWRGCPTCSASTGRSPAPTASRRRSRARGARWWPTCAARRRLAAGNNAPASAWEVARRCARLPRRGGAESAVQPSQADAPAAAPESATEVPPGWSGSTRRTGRRRWWRLSRCCAPGRARRLLSYK